VGLSREVLSPSAVKKSREHRRLVATAVVEQGDIDWPAGGVDEAITPALEKWDRVSVHGIRYSS
jgi:hypothetical protein